jgi:hypothetical protein
MSLLGWSDFLTCVVACLKLPRGRFAAANLARRAFGAPFEAFLRVQDAPRVSSASSDLLAITKFASPNRLNSCAVFLASPL